MELFVDSEEWVMGPNVYGMALFADGGLVTSKPYICGSNYLLRMSDYRRGDWCEVVDGLFWRFVAKHRQFFGSQPGLIDLVRNLDSMDGARRRRLQNTANNFLQSKTIARVDAA
jgi:deoxyribodipyrimidine photolyase-related protein